MVSGSNSGVTQSFAVTPGASYTASVYAMTPAANPLTGSISAELQLLFYDSSNTQISSYSPPNQIVVLSGSSATGGPLAGSVGGEGWNHFFTTAAAPANAVTVKVQLTTYSGGGSFGGAVYFDAAKFGPRLRDRRSSPAEIWLITERSRSARRIRSRSTAPTRKRRRARWTSNSEMLHQPASSARWRFPGRRRSPARSSPT